MGKLLRLNNGTEYTATIDSTITGINISVDNYGYVDVIRQEMTAGNLSHVEFDGRTYTDLTLVSESAHRSGNKVLASFTMELGIEDRIEQERQDAVDAYTLQLIEEGLL